jgi:RNA polymerase sigma-70 factor (ECF subfamily)
VDQLKSRTDAELLELAAKDRQAFARLYQRHERLIVGFFMSRTRSAELAADLTAETFIGLLESAHRFDSKRSGGASVVPWMLSIARHTLFTSLERGIVADKARRRLECEPVVLDDGALARVEEMASVDRRLSGLLDDLPEDLRIVVTARVLDERDYADIATELDCSEQVVRKRLSRGLLRLRAALSSANS